MGGEVRERPTDLHVELEDLLPALVVRDANGDVPVESPGPGECGVQGLWQVCGRHDDDALVLLKAVHLHQELIQGLPCVALPLLSAAAHGVNLRSIRQSARARGPGKDERREHGRRRERVSILETPWRRVMKERTHLVDEDDARALLLCGREEAPNSAAPDADKHLLKLRSGSVKERHACFSRGSLGEQGLPSPGGSSQEDALGQLSSESGELAGILEVLNDLLEFCLGLVTSLDVLEGLYTLFGHVLLFRTKRKRVVPPHATKGTYTERVSCESIHL